MSLNSGICNLTGVREKALRAGKELAKESDVAWCVLHSTLKCMLGIMRYSPDPCVCISKRFARENGLKMANVGITYAA